MKTKLIYILVIFNMSISKFCFNISNFLNEAPKQAAYSIERITRPWQLANVGCEATKFNETIARIKSAITGIICIPLSLIDYPISFIISSIGYFFQNERLNIDLEDLTCKKNLPKSIKIIFLNICCQSGPFSQMTGDQIHPLERFDKVNKTRIDAIVKFSTQKNPDIICFQEAHDPMAVKKIRLKLQQKGYRVISDDLVHPFFVNSGLMVAVKKTIPIANTHLIEYPLKDRAGITKGAMQGCISLDLVNNEGVKILKLMTTHLAYGNKEHIKQTRRRQLTGHVFTTFSSEEKIILGGDFNEHHLLSSMQKENYLRYRYFSDCNSKKSNSRVTIGQMRKKKQKEECVDGVINSNIKITNADLIEPKLNGKYISDHFATFIECSY